MKPQKLDVLAIASHPDDVELGCAGTVASLVSAGKKVGIVDLTKGEMGTRGTPEIRQEEALASAKILGVETRENLGFPDVYFTNTNDYQLAVIQVIRRYQPEVILTNAVSDRHPDHGKGADLIKTSWFMAGLSKIITLENGKEQPPWRPRILYHFIQSIHIEPDFLVDVSKHWQKKIEAIRAYKSQFHDPESNEPETYISSPTFMKALEARSVEWGHQIGVEHAEGFTINRKIGVRQITDLI